MFDSMPSDEPEDGEPVLARVLDALANLEAMPSATTANAVTAALEDAFQKLGIGVEKPTAPEQSTADLLSIVKEKITIDSARGGADGWFGEAANHRQERISYIGFPTKT